MVFGLSSSFDMFPIVQEVLVVAVGASSSHLALAWELQRGCFLLETANLHPTTPLTSCKSEPFSPLTMA